MICAVGPRLGPDELELADGLGQSRRVAGALDRFRVLPLADPPAEPPRESPSSDLFEHFGVQLDARGPTRPRPVVEVRACRHCGWWLSIGTPQPCPICAESSEA